MAAFTNVQVYPMSGWWDRPWGESAAQDSLARQSRAVCERYREALRLRPPQNRSSTLRIFMSGADDPHMEGRDVLVLAARPEGFESARLAVPSDFSHRPVDVRSEWILNAIHSACMELAGLRGLPAEPFESAREHVETHGYGFSWAAGWKHSPGRNFRARCHFDLQLNGFGQLKIEVRRKDGALIDYTTPQIAWTTFESFTRSAKSFHWLNSRSFSVVPSVGVWGLVGDEFMVGIEISPDGHFWLQEGPRPLPTGPSSRS
jgi:hypothetical protein